MDGHLRMHCDPERRDRQPKAPRLAGAFAVLLALAASSLPADAGAQAKTRINLPSAFASNLPLLGDGAVKFANRVAAASNGALEIRVNEPGTLIPPLQVIQAVSKGSVEAGWSNDIFFSSVDSAFPFFTAVPFGPAASEYMAWMYHGGGLELSREMYAKHGVHNIPCAIVPPEASGWFRKEINSVQDLKGLKMRITGLGASVLAKLGVAPQTLAAGDIFQALQLGSIDAAEFSAPTIDQKLGFHQVAKYYYFPGWHQQATFGVVYFNKQRWDSLPAQQRAIIEQACGDNIREMLAEGEATQFRAMNEMRDKNGAQLRRWSPEILASLERAWGEVVAEESAKNPNFKRVFDSYTRFRKDYAIWREYGYLR